mmetsp:Transcript_11869/g.28767  ORF Transcript_11869/g.28767 Transcript_11869/m.28767 type:complete len:144 (+) Transcript_11869:109-540(+)
MTALAGPSTAASSSRGGPRYPYQGSSAMEQVLHCSALHEDPASKRESKSVPAEKPKSHLHYPDYKQSSYENAPTLSNRTSLDECRFFVAGRLGKKRFAETHSSALSPTDENIFAPFRVGKGRQHANAGHQVSKTSLEQMRYDY